MMPENQDAFINNLTGDLFQKQFQKQTDKQTERKPHYLIQFFTYGHLPENLKHVSMLFCDLAYTIDSTLPDNPEKTTALRKLLEAKDCAVRAIIFK